MVSLIETYKIPDQELISAIGNSYGDIYETQYKWATGSKLNKHEVALGFEENILPILKGKL